MKVWDHMQVQRSIMLPEHRSVAVSLSNLSITYDEQRMMDLAAVHRLLAVRMLKAACPGRSAMAARIAMVLQALEGAVQDDGLRAEIRKEVAGARATLVLFFGPDAVAGHALW